MTGLFEPVPVVKQFPWINTLMGLLPNRVVRQIAPDIALFLGAKAVSCLPHNFAYSQSSISLCLTTAEYL